MCVHECDGASCLGQGEAVDRIRVSWKKFTDCLQRGAGTESRLWLFLDISEARRCDAGVCYGHRACQDQGEEAQPSVFGHVQQMFFFDRENPAGKKVKN